MSYFHICYFQKNICYLFELNNWEQAEYNRGTSQWDSIKETHQTNPFDLPLFAFPSMKLALNQDCQKYIFKDTLEALLQDISCPPIPAFPCLTVEKFTGGHPCTQIGRGSEGWEGGEHLVTLATALQKFPHPIFSILHSHPGETRFKVSEWIFVIFFFQEYILSGREGIWKTCGGTIWISYRPGPLLFRWQRALGLSGDLPRPTKLLLACTMGASFEFPSKLVSILPTAHLIWISYLVPKTHELVLTNCPP